MKLKKLFITMLTLTCIGVIGVGFAACETEETGKTNGSSSAQQSGGNTDNSSQGGTQTPSTPSVVTPSEGLVYTLSEDGSYYMIEDIGTCTDTKIVIPSTYNNLPVTHISWSAFYNCDSLTEIVIPDSVTSIGSGAFWGCDSLTEIIIPDSVTSIGYDAFEGCDSLTSVTIGSGVTSIEGETFSGCSSLTDIVIPDSVTSIGESAFSDCDLMSVTIGNGVTSIGGYAFRYCDKLVEVYNKSSLTVTAGSTENGYVGYYAKNIYTPTSGESKLSTDSDGYIIYTDGEDKLLMGYMGTKTELMLPEDITEIYQYAFYGNNKIASVTIPDRVGIPNLHPLKDNGVF